MTEYITKEQAIDEVWDAFTSRDDPDLGRVIEENIKRLPAADVTPIVYGKWLNGIENAVCSNCKITYEAYYSKYQYCPKCGARMDEK